MGRERWTTRQTVEECAIQLCADQCLRNGLFGFRPGDSGFVCWHPKPDGAPFGRLNFEIRPHGQDGWAICFLRQALTFDGSLRMGSGQTLPVTTTRPHFGGKRYWFRCECGRRSGRLYLPSGETLFRCRLCCDLTYQSAQEHNTRQGVLRPIIEQYRRDVEKAMARRASAQRRDPRPPYLWKT
jgi:hypothetical protein